MRVRFSVVALATCLACTAIVGTPAWAADDTMSSEGSKVAPKDAGAAADDKVPPKASTEKPSVPPSVTVIDSWDARGILGRDVRSAANENMGRIADVIVDRGGQTRAAVIDFGGFLGVGMRKIVVDWNALQFNEVANKGASISLALTRDQVRAAPEYKEDQPIIALGQAGILEPLRYPAEVPDDAPDDQQPEK